jgi:hypothetical protein
MRLTQKLLGYLNRVFDKDPKAFIGLRVNYAGGMTWSVSDEVLTTAVTGGPGNGLTIDLTQYTLQTLAEYIAGQSGYSVAYLDSTKARLSATVLLDGAGDQSQSNGDHLYGYTSLLWAYMEAVARQLTDAETQVAAAPQQLNVVDGEGMWLDEIGSYYGVPRKAGELDVQYGPRIIAEVLRPRSNNIALENAIEAYTGQSASVVDVIIYGGAIPLYDGTITHDGSHTHDGGSSPLYGLFDVQYAYDLINGGDLTSFQATVRAIIERLRSAGTHLRALALQGSALSDSFTAPTDSSSTLAVSMPMTDALTAPTESMAAVAAVLGALLDSLTAPDDTAALGLSINYDYAYNGIRLYDGTIKHLGGSVGTETI